MFVLQALNSVCEMTQDFTDSAYTPHHHREQIIDFLEECRFEVGNLMRPEMVCSYYACQMCIQEVNFFGPSMQVKSRISPSHSHVVASIRNEPVLRLRLLSSSQGNAI